ncbi:MAG: carboxypeptidase regulatory-like domain-containing protein [Deltaproteobacteria bacterium]|nr:carboxypeptidase regulatory-like domain-containing protein [Deltaproteobacteria bacterium]
MRGLAYAVALLGLAVGCDVPAPTSAPPRRVAFDLIEFRAQSDERAQPAGEHTWSGRENDTVAVQMTAPVQALADVTPVETLAGLPDDIDVFLDGAGQLGDFGIRLDSSSQFSQPVLPSTYDVLVAPDGLLGRHPARLITPVTFQNSLGPGEELEWALEETQEVLGEVLTWSTGVPVEGAVVTLFRAAEPRLPLGVSTTTDADGAFFFEVPEGQYDIVVAGPSDGSVAIAPVRRLAQQLPLSVPGVALRMEVWPLQPIPVRGTLRRSIDSTAAGRVRVQGRIDDPFNNASGLRTGLYRAEFETEGDGSWEIELPPGTYDVTGIPRYSPEAPSLGLGKRTIVVPGNQASLDGQDIQLPPNVDVRIDAFNPDGSPMLGATILLRMRSAPRYMWRRVTGATGSLEGSWFGEVIEDEYDIELIPPPDADGNSRIARVQLRETLGPGTPAITINARRSDRFQGFVFTEGERAAGDVRVMVRDPDTGDLLDTVISRDDTVFAGVFEVVVPR